MNMRDYQTLHLDINKSKGTALIAVLYFTIIVCNNEHNFISNR